MSEIYGNYQLIKRIATGGMAQIYLARQRGPEGFEKLLVVKRILPHLAENDEFVRMFLDEARIAARLNHPNIVQIFNLGAQDDSFFIAMEYIHGEDVRRVWKRAEALGMALPIPLVCRVIMEACAGLDYAHKKTDPQGKPLDIVHRDISPQNILVTFQGGVKVVDFGIAKAADQATVTRSGVLKGKYSYMSPEQASGRRIDCRSDIFALGIVLWELLTGRRLFKRENEIQTLNAVTECKVLPPSKVNPRVPADLDAVVLKALARDANDRYQEAAELQMALEDWLLTRQLPSSSAHLATFMQELYTERLALEAQEGQVLVEELDPSRSKDDEGKPKSRTPSRASRSRSPDETRSDPDSTRQERERAAWLEPPEVETRLLPKAHEPHTAAAPRPTARRVRSAQVVAAGVVLAAAAAVAFFVGRPMLAAKDGGVLRIESEPPGAAVTFNGAPLDGVTPLSLPKSPAGTYSLVLSKEGFADLRTAVQVPAGGEQALAAFTLSALAAPPTRPSPIEAAAPSTVQVSVRSEPAGAAVFVDGVEQAKTPATLSFEAGRPATLRLEQAGYKSLVRTVTPTADGPPELSLSLEKVRERPRAGRLRPDGLKADPYGARATEDKLVRREAGKDRGFLRVVVTPYADVQCGPYRLGQTPFEDKVLPAGEYDCRFTNSELGKSRTEHVVVRANETSRVTVRF